MTITPAQLGALRALGTLVLFTVLTWLGDTTHLAPFVNSTVASIISMLALGIEHNVESASGKALFGNATVRRAS